MSEIKIISGFIPVDQQHPKCTCLDSAYERQAIAQGLNDNPVFQENIDWLNERKFDQTVTNGEAI